MNKGTSSHSWSHRPSRWGLRVSSSDAGFDLGKQSELVNV